MEVEQNAASTPALEIPKGSQDYANWRLTGKLPKAAEAAKETPAESAEAAAADTSKETQSENAAESEAAQQQESKGKGKGAEDRIKQLIAEKKELERKLAEKAEQKPEGKETKPAESSTAKPAEQKLEAPKKPKLDDFKTYEEYDAAKDKYFEDLADYKAMERLNKHIQQQAQQARNQQLAQQLTDARTRYADADQVIAPAAKAIMEDAAIPPVVKAMVDDSPVMLDVLYKLGKGELSKFVETARTKPLDAVRQLAALEAELKGTVKESTGKQAARGADGKFAKAEEAEAPAKETPKETVTKAPPPPREVGGRGSQPPDEVQAAVKANDFRTFRNAQNRRDLAGRRR